MEYLQCIYAGAVLSVLPAAILTAMICGLWAWALKRACGQKLLERAKQRGHIVTAEKTASGGRRAVYQYVWKEKTYRCRPLGAGAEQPQTLELYFLRSPARACTAEKVGRFRPWLVFLTIELLLTIALLPSMHEVLFPRWVLPNDFEIG